MIEGLAYAAVIVRDVEDVAAKLEGDFGLARHDLPVGADGHSAPVFAVGDAALALFELGDPFVGGVERPGLHHIALAAEDPEAAAAGIAVDQVGSGPGLGGSRRIMLSREATAGVRTCICEPVLLENRVSGRVERFDHIGVASADNAVAVDVFCHRLGCPVESTQTDLEVEARFESFTSDKYGIVYHSRPPEVVAGLRVAFATVGDCELEFLENLDPSQVGGVDHGRSGTTRQDQGAISRYIESRGPGLHHVALKVTDIEGLLADLGRAGYTLVDTNGRPGSRRSRIAFIHPSSLGGFLMHLVQRDEH